MAQSYVRKHPLDGRGHLTMGYAYHSQGNYRPALPYFEKALELSPEYYLTHHFLGESLFLLGEMEASRAQHEAHLAADPTEPSALYGIGLVDLEESRLDAAEARFRDALALYDAMKKTNRRLYDSKKVGLARCHARLRGPNALHGLRRLLDAHGCRGDRESTSRSRGTARRL